MPTVKFESIPADAEVKVLWKALRYIAVTDTLTKRSATMSDKLLPLGSFTTAETKAQFDTEIKEDRDLMFCFCHGLDGCLFDENGYCTIYADSNLSSKILVLNACHSGKSYARNAVRTYGASAALGYGTSLVCQLAGDGFKEGFEECFLNAQKELLKADKLDKDSFMLAYQTTKDLYNSWGDKYSAEGDAVCANLFYANAKNLLHYSKWDVSTNVNINISPEPAEIWLWGSYIGLAPLGGHKVMSGGNVFRYKAKGCFLSGLITNVPESGGTYNLSPMSNFNKNVRSYDAIDVYLEYDKEIYIPAPPFNPEPFEMVFYNYGDSDKHITEISNDRRWHHSCLSLTIKPHLITGIQCLIYIDEEFEHRKEAYTEWINITVNIEGIKDNFSVLIWIEPRHEEKKLKMEAEKLEEVVPSSILNFYTRASLRERKEKKYAIGEKLYSLEDIIEEIRKGTEIGRMFM